MKTVMKRFLIVATAFHLSAVAATESELEIGRRIYQEGRLSSGELLTIQRFGKTAAAGVNAACITCHRPSGMGSVEGEFIVPPITGKALFADNERVIATMDPRVGKAFNRPHLPYAPDTFARAVRAGVDVGGREMHPLMPRYALSDADVQALFAYVTSLSIEWSPGVSATKISFATVIAPGVDPAKKTALTTMVNAIVKAKNGSTNPGKRYMTSPAEMMLKTGRVWEVDLWQLEGPPETWRSQLDAFYRRKPVFALVSGLTDSSWEPVDEFCQQARLPCIFPSVDSPPASEGRYRPVYFSRGSILEADVLQSYLQSNAANPKGRIVQVYSGYAGEKAAERVKEANQRNKVVVDNRAVVPGSAASLAKALVDVEANDMLVMWLPPDEMAMLAAIPVPHTGGIYGSGKLIEGHLNTIPAHWKSAVKLIYPYELPERRPAQTSNLKAWLQLKNIPLVNEAFQSEVFFAFNFVTDTISDMLNNLYRDYLIERVESMISFREGSKGEQELRDRAVLGRSTLRGNHAQGSALPESVELLRLGQRERGAGVQSGTTVYPRLSLGQGQRFASKGAYIAEFSGAGEQLHAVSDWLIP